GIRRLPCTAPTILPAGQPASATVCAGTPASFSVTASGSPPFSYQWRKDGTPISGANAATYAIAAALVGDAGSYTCDVASNCGSITSAAATLTVNVAPQVTGQPQPVEVCAGSPASFTVAAGGTGPLGYQWRRNGAPISGATGATYAIGATV